MRALMYHYVRPAPRGLPHLRYLHVEDFAAQLDALAAKHQLLRAEQFLSILDGAPAPENALILTFDDGLAEHALHAAPAMETRGLTGLFFVPTGPLADGKPLDVHRIHNLLGRFGGGAVLEALRRHMDAAMVDPAKRQQFAAATYRHQSNDAATTEAKRLLNYFLTEAARAALLDRLEAELGVAADWARDFYLDAGQIADLRRRGHIVGSHGVSHRVLSTLSEAEQRGEIDRSFAALAAIGGGGQELFCYPYGGRDTFNNITRALLAQRNCRAAFAVEPRPITPADLADRFALPRFDCNMFAFGQASLGAQRAAGRVL